MSHQQTQHKQKTTTLFEKFRTRQESICVLCLPKVPALVTWNSICVWAKGPTTKKKKEEEAATVKTPTHTCVCLHWHGVQAHSGFFLQPNKNCINDVPTPTDFWSLCIWDSIFRLIAQQLLLRWLCKTIFACFRSGGFALRSTAKVKGKVGACTFAERRQCKAGRCPRRKHINSQHPLRQSCFSVA